MSSDYCRDRIAIQDVMSNYAAGVDERDMERYASCFAVDVEVVGFGDQTIHGLSAWLDYVWGALEKYAGTQHLLSPVHAVIDGDSADLRTDVQAVHFMAHDGSKFILWATYLTKMQRIDSAWRITRHELKVCGMQSD